MKLLNNYESASIHITDTCNLKCPGCYSVNNRKNNIIEYDNIAKFLNYFSPKNVVFFGGEAILYPKIIQKVVENYPNINFSLHTNGTLYNKNNKHIYEYFKYIFLSLDSFDFNWLKKYKGFSLKNYTHFMELIDNCGNKISITKNILPKNNDRNWFKDLEKYNFPVDYYLFVTKERDQEFLNEFRTIKNEELIHDFINVNPKIRLLQNGIVSKDMRGIYNFSHIDEIIQGVKNNNIEAYVMPVSEKCKRCSFFYRCPACNIFPHFVKDILENINYIPHFCKFAKMWWRE